MDYKDYKTASERHLETCIRLKEVVAANYLNKTLLPHELKKQNEILANIYYLSGYVIETIVSYGILKFIEIEKIYVKWNFNDFKKLHCIYYAEPSKKYNVSYHFNELNTKWSIYNKNHNISKNLDFFTIEAGLTGLNIRGIDLTIKDSNLKQMLRNWKTDYRYNIDFGVTLNFTNIFSFLTLAEEIHNGIIREITKDKTVC